MNQNHAPDQLRWRVEGGLRNLDAATDDLNESHSFVGEDEALRAEEIGAG